MIDGDPAKHPDAVLIGSVRRSNLALRIVSSLVLAPLAIGAAYLGGLPFLAFWTVAALCVLWEWDTLVTAQDRRPVLTIGWVAIGGAAILLAFGRTVSVIALVALGMMGAATLASKSRRSWCLAGILYSGAILIAPVLLRRDDTFGFTALIFVFAVVWSTDIAAYFAGRAIGGPKLMPLVSPNKTWSGAIGGAIGAVIAAFAVAHFSGLGNPVAIGVLALALCVVSQAGDLLESAIKRQFGAKDASGLIPGHGGLMDRLDGFLLAAVAAAAIGILRGGLEAPATGLLVW